MVVMLHSCQALKLGKKFGKSGGYLDFRRKELSINEFFLNTILSLRNEMDAPTDEPKYKGTGY